MLLTFSFKFNFYIYVTNSTITYMKSVCSTDSELHCRRPCNSMRLRVRKCNFSKDAKTLTAKKLGHCMRFSRGVFTSTRVDMALRARGACSPVAGGVLAASADARAQPAGGRSAQHRAACRISTPHWRQTTKHATPFAWQCYCQPTFSNDTQLYFENNAPYAPQQLAEYAVFKFADFCVLV